MDDLFIYLVPMPTGIHEYITPCSDGYTVYIDDKLDNSQRMDALLHAVRHLLHGDFGRADVQRIEAEARW